MKYREVEGAVSTSSVFKSTKRAKSEGGGGIATDRTSTLTPKKTMDVDRLKAQMFSSATETETKKVRIQLANVLCAGL